MLLGKVDNLDRKTKLYPHKTHTHTHTHTSDRFKTETLKANSSNLRR